MFWINNNKKINRTERSTIYNTNESSLSVEKAGYTTALPSLTNDTINKKTGMKPLLGAPKIKYRAVHVL